MIVLVGNQKGGCGKSTTAANISAALAVRGHDVVLVDTDNQATAATWAADRNEQKQLPVVHCIQKYGNVHGTLLDLEKRYGYVVVDAGGRDSRELRTAMTAADILLVPFRPSQPDLDVIHQLEDVIIQAKDINAKLAIHGLITMAPTNHVIKEADEAKEYLEQFPDINLLKSIICDRKVYRDSMSNGHGVVEMDNPKAKFEIERLLKEIL